MDADTQAETVVAGSPAETVVADTPAETVVAGSPAETVVADTPAETVIADSPIEAVVAAPPVEVVLGDSPVDAVDADPGVEIPAAVVPDGGSAASMMPAEPVPAEALAETPDLAAPDSAPEGLNEEPTVEPEVSQTTATSEDRPATETVPAVEPPLPSPEVEVASVAQEEAAEPQVAEVTPEPSPVVAAEPEPPEPTVCARVGPFEPADADALLQKLPGNFELLSDNSEEQTVDDSYYVLIPALPDRATGLSKLKELKAAGFEDTWLFRRGAYENAISLGLFRRERSAKRHASKVADKGFDVEVRARTTTKERRWLQLKHAGDDMQGAVPLPDGVTLTPQACP